MVSVVRPPVVAPIVVRPPDPLQGLTADTPIVLLPVRIETRWFPAADRDHLELRIRVIPDEIHVSAPLSVTTAERADVATYYAAAAGDRETAFARLVERAGDSRAAWLVRALAPGALVVPDADQVTDPSRVVAMPDHWIAIAKSATSRTVATGTAIATDLAASPTANDTPNGALGAALAWVTDFAIAETKGMALRMTVAASDAATLEELIVIGVRAADTTTGSTVLGDLIARHASCDGAALLSPGTPTNVAPDRDGARATGSQGPWRGNGTLTAIGPTPNGDAARVATALGVPSGALVDVATDHVDRGAIARSMHVALWPATWGYYLKDLAALDATSIGSARSLFLDHVRGQGVLPSLRLRSQPYGLLPATSLARWPAGSPRGGLAAFLNHGQAAWTTATTKVPRLVDSQDLDGDIVAIMRRGPSSLGAWVREVIDRDTGVVALTGILGAVASMDAELQRIKTAIAAQLLGVPATMPAWNMIYADALAKLGIPFVAPAAAARDLPLAHDYLSGIANASTAELENNAVDGADPRTLLYLLARYAITHVQWDWVISATAASTTTTTTTRALERTVATGVTSATGATTVASATSMWGKIGGAGTIVLTNPAVVEVKNALKALGAAPVRELDAAFASVLDTASYRIDAWCTAIANERLAQLRAAAPTASYLGGWAWLEKPRPAGPAAPEGFLHAPSVTQARTAAVLRAGYEAHRKDGAGTSLEIELTSQRVHDARWLLSGMRDGRSLNDMLGDHVETWLGDHGHIDLVHGLRGGKDLIDGWALYHQWGAARPAAPLDAAFDDLVEFVDGAADLLVADSVHNALANSPARSGAALDALQRGEVATPDPRVDRTLTDGDRTQRRVVLMLPEAPAWPGAARPRAVAAPRLEGFAARLLGAPAAVTLSLVVDGATVTRSLADLAMCALDAVLLAAEAGAQGFLDAAGKAATGSVTSITGGPELDRVVLVGCALARLLRGARTPIAGELGAVTVSAPVDRTTAVNAATAALDPQTKAVMLATGFAVAAPITAPSSLAAVAAQPGELASWLSDLGRVRTALEPLDLLMLIAPDALPVERRRTADGVELVVFGPTSAPAEALVIDAWSEAPPASTIATGVAFPFQAPRAQPAQTVLIAVPPPATPWSLALAEAIIDETITRAKGRMISPADIRNQLAPTLLVADDPAELVPSIDLQAVSAVVEVAARV